MPFVKFEPDEKDQRCRHPEHDPPGHIVLKPGTYTYECPACGQRQTFRVTRPTLDSSRRSWNRHGMPPNQDQFKGLHEMLCEIGR
jgi:hypothetical protein